MARSLCTKELYRTFLQATSARYSGLALSEVSPIELSHDSVSRWLKSKAFRPADLWELSEPLIDKKRPCLLIADDTVLDKSRSEKRELVHYQYSGNKHAVIAGIGLVNLLWHDLETKESLPVDYRVYDKDTDGKTKNTHFCELLSSAKRRGLEPEAVVMDTWYSSLDNLKAIRSHGWIWITPLRKNRIVNKNSALESLIIPKEGLCVHLRGYGWVTVFKFVAKNGRIDYVATNKTEPTRDYVETIMKERWSIEVYHRELKQTCGLERCQVRTGRAQRNHIFLALSAWVSRYKRRLTEQYSFYQQQWDVIKTAISQHMRTLLSMTFA